MAKEKKSKEQKDLERAHKKFRTKVLNNIKAYGSTSKILLELEYYESRQSAPPPAKSVDRENTILLIKEAIDLFLNPPVKKERTIKAKPNGRSN